MVNWLNENAVSEYLETREVLENKGDILPRVVLYTC